jgi:dTMP kinase
VGVLVAIEGIDGAGKGTQAELFRKRATAEGITCAVVSFPRYGENAFAQAIAAYLNGDFGSSESIHPKLAALLYAGDRFASRSILIEALASNEVVVCDRYVASNMAHQAAKLPRGERDDFISWLGEIEFGIYQMPRPELTLLLDMPLATARQLVRRKAARSYTSLAEDIHERDREFMSSSREVFLALADAEAQRGTWARIDCGQAPGIPRSSASIALDVWNAIAPRLALKDSV